MQGEQTNSDELPESVVPDHLTMKHGYPSKIHALLRTQSGVRYFAAALVTIIAVGLGLWWTAASITTPIVSDKIAVPKPKPKYFSPLTGATVANEAAMQRAVTGVMIENSPDARPQSGLKDAGIVYEAVAEGGITRFVALYQESRPALIGPVRSVRPYYVEWASAYDPAVAHIGGSARALSMIRSGNYGVDLDQFFNAGAYWRANDRVAPHNVYTSFDKLDALRESKGKTTSSFTGFAREDVAKLPEPTATNITIGVSSGQFLVQYAYDKASNTYLRSHGGVEHNDREGGRISPKVVVALKVPMSLGFEDGYREQLTTTGSGSAYVFQNGIVTEGTWHRDGDKGQLRLLDASGKDIKLNRGQTWITALADDRTVSWQ